MAPESTLRAGYRLVLHGLASEMLYELLGQAYFQVKGLGAAETDRAFN